MFHYYHKVRDGTYTQNIFCKLTKMIQESMKKTLSRGAALTETQMETKTAKTCSRLLKAWDSLWLFVNHPEIEPTNNRAERALRSYVIWRKLSFGTQSERGNRFIERMMTVAATYKQQERNVLEFITEAIESTLANKPTPSLVLRESE